MRLLYDIFPTFLFFIIFKTYGIYAATLAGIIATALQVCISWIVLKKWDKAQWITLLVFVTFGGLTLYFHNPIFVKWKPTIVFWVFAVAFIISQYFTPTPLIQRFMQRMLAETDIPGAVWQRLNLLWASFFTVLGGINLYIAYHFNNDVWVNFKFYGITSATLALSLLQAVYLSRYLVKAKDSN